MGDRLARVRIVVLVVVALLLGAAVPGAANAQDADPTFFTTDIADGRRSSVYTLVADDSTGGTQVLERHARSGDVLAQFAQPAQTVGVALTARRSGRVYVARNDGVVSVYARRGPSRYRQVAQWPISIPGVQGTPAISAIDALPRGHTAIALAVEATDINDPALFAGVVVLDRRGRTVATWETPPPPSGAPNTATVVPLSMTVAPTGDVFVVAEVCDPVSCGFGTFPGFLYRLDVTRARGSLDLDLERTWQSQLLLQISELDALSARRFVAVPARFTTTAGEGVAWELGVGAQGVQRIGTFFPRPNRVPTRAAVKFAPGPRRPTVYLLEGRPITAQQDAAFIERFRPVTRRSAGRTVWLPRGPAWTASWGPDGPPAP